MSKDEQLQPPQQQDQPGKEGKMRPEPKSKAREYLAAGKLKDKTALITGGDSGIGRSVAIAFAREGANVSIIYLNEHEDAHETERLVKQEGKDCLLISGDIADCDFCESAVDKTFDHFGRLDILVNNAAEQHQTSGLEEITNEQLHRTFATNIFSQFYMTRRALKYLKEGASIINTTSITAYRGSTKLLDYSTTKGAIVAFTRSLSNQLLKKNIRVNCVAPGPIWTPLIPASFDEENVEIFGSSVPMNRAGQPDEVAPCYVFLASEDSSYMSGQTLHPNGGYIVNG